MRPIKDLLAGQAFKQTLQKSLLVTSIALLAACGSDSDSTTVNTEFTALTADTVPAGFTYSTSTDTATYYADEVYGPDVRNKFDIFLPVQAEGSEAPTSLIIFVHGGGFFAGDKSDAIYSFATGSPVPDAANIADVNEVLDAGVAYATINYSLLDVPGFSSDATITENDTVGISKSLSDVKEALQYIRHNAAEFNVDPAKIAMYGESAGASSSLWLAYSDDMADTSASASSNASASTRIVAAGAIETQGSMDVVRWEEILEPLQVTLEVAATFTLPLMESVLAIPATQGEEVPGTASIALIEASTGDIADFRATLDFPALIDAEDPAVFVSNANPDWTLQITGDNLVEIGTIAATVPVKLAAAAVEFAEGGDRAAGIALHDEVSVMSARADVLGPLIVNGLLHAPTHASTIATAAAEAGATVVANIPFLGMPEPNGITVIPFLLEELGEL
ncbi:MAG: hypothetical protein ACI843_002719 [Psychrobacter glaciei]|jgi:hypothetical protein